MARTTTLGRVGWVAAFALVASPLFAQDDGSGVAPGTNGGSPRQNVSSGGLSARRPGLIIQGALHGEPEITQTEEERDAPRPRETRKFSVQILLSILDGLQQAIIQSFGQLLPSLLGDNLTSGGLPGGLLGGLPGGLDNDLFNQMLADLLANSGNAKANPVPPDSGGE